VETLVVVPTYEEVENVGPLITAVLGLSPEYSVMVVDDASPDGTAAAVGALARAHPGRVTLVSRPGKGGHGAAYRQGLLQALRGGRHEALFVMDCDFSHDPSAIPVLRDALAAADLVIGSRYVPGGRVVGWGPHRHVLSRAANGVARALLGLPIRDCTSGFMGFRSAALRAIPLAEARAEGYAAPVEMKWLCVSAGLRCLEVPITFRDRERGSSKLNGWMVLDAARGLWRLSAERRTRRAARTRPTSEPDPPRPT
jgi:dolichol-phosphate mannosyltransferase